MVADCLSRPITRSEPWRLTLRHRQTMKSVGRASRPPVVRKTHPTKIFRYRMDFSSGLIPNQANTRFSAPTLMKCE
jgi:hypothetical protein